MLSLQKILALLFLAALVIAVPTAPIDPNPPPKALPGQPYGKCDIKDRFVYDHYHLRGVNWNVTEWQLKKKLQSGTATITAWKWTERETDFGQIFEAQWNLPADMVGRTDGKLKKLVAPWELKVHCTRRHTPDKSKKDGSELWTWDPVA